MKTLLSLTLIVVALVPFFLYAPTEDASPVPLSAVAPPLPQRHEVVVQNPVKQAPQPAGRKAPLFTTPKKEHDYLALFPKTTSSNVNSLKDTVQFYDEGDMPTIYQVWDQGARSGFMRVRGGQQTANLEFPWANPAGTVENSNFRSFRFVEFGGQIQWWRNIVNGRFHGFMAEYAPNTVFGEILTVIDPDGFDHAFEMRLRKKRDDGTWSVESYRPYPTESSFDAALRLRGFAPYEHDRGTVRRLSSSHDRNGFSSTALLVKLPILPPATVIDMLDNEIFAPAKDKMWRSEGQVAAASPVATGFNIVPRNFMGTFIPVNGDSCMRCHADAGNVVNHEGDERWRLRGMDGIFSFSIIDLSTGQARLDPKLVKAGLLVHRKGMP
jgi:hypothetical protein